MARLQARQPIFTPLRHGNTHRDTCSCALFTPIVQLYVESLKTGHQSFLIAAFQHRIFLFFFDGIWCAKRVYPCWNKLVVWGNMGFSEWTVDTNHPYLVKVSTYFDFIDTSSLTNFLAHSGMFRYGDQIFRLVCQILNLRTVYSSCLCSRRP